jgi:hypothetical protein
MDKHFILTHVVLTVLFNVAVGHQMLREPGSSAVGGGGVGSKQAHVDECIRERQKLLQQSGTIVVLLVTVRSSPVWSIPNNVIHVAM